MAYNEISTDKFSPVMGAFFGISLIMTIWFLDRVQGKAYRIQDFLADREWHILKDEKVIQNVNFMLKLSCWIFFTLPIITLIFWGSGVIYRLDDESDSVSPGVAIFLVGFGIIALLWGVFKIKWNRYRTSIQSTLSILLAVVLMTAYKMVVVFVDEDETFYAISSIFLTTNAIVMIVLVFLNNPKGGLTVHDVVQKLPKGDELDINRNTNYDDEITDSYQNDDYIPTQSEIYEMFTLNRVSKRVGLRGVFDGGFAKLYRAMPTGKRMCISLSLYSLALVLLGLYAYLDYEARDNSGIGIITMIAIIATDLLIYLYIYSKIADNPAEISLHIIIFRICMFVLDGDYWIYGYCILFMYIGFFLSHHIAKKRFPFLEQVIEDHVEEADAELRSKFDLATTPEFLLILSTVMFATLLGVMQAVQPDDAPLKAYTIDNETYPFWAFGLFSTLFVFWFFFLLLAARIFIRRKTGVESKMHVFVHFKDFDLLFFFLTIDYILSCLIAVLLWWATTDERYLIVGTLAPLAVCFLVNAFLRLILNDYRYTQNISKLNRFIAKHNKKIVSVHKRVKKYKKAIASRTGKNIQNMTLTAEEIQELSKKQLRHDDKMSDDDSDEELKQQSIKEDDEEEEKAPVKKAAQNDEEEDEIYEGGKENEDDVGASKFDGARTKSSAIPKSADKVFRNENLNKNLFGRVAEIIIHGDKEISYDGDYSQEVRSTKKFKPIENWKKKTNACGAFFSCKLRPNDYHIWISIMMALLCLIGIAVAISSYHETVEGITWFVGLLHVMIAYGVMARPLACDAETNVVETIIYVLSHVMVYAWGFADFAIRFDFEADKGGDDNGSYFLVWYITFIPFFTLLTTSLLKWYDANWKFGTFVLITLPCAIVTGIGCLICCFIFIGPISGVLISIVVGLTAYFAFIMKIYVANDHFLPKYWKLGNYAIMIVIGIAALIVGIFYDSLNSFLGWSITYGIFGGIICLDGLVEMFLDITNATEEPIYFSPWVYPVFKYVAKKNDIVLRNGPTTKIFLALFIAYMWSFQAAVWIDPYYYGVSITCLVEVLTMVFIMFVTSFTPALLEDNKPQLDQLLVKRSWLEAKNDYVQTKSIATPESMITFEEVAKKRDDIVNHLKKLNKDANFAKEEHNADWNLTGIDTASMYQCRKYLHATECEKTDIYLDELSLMIHFELLLILHSQNLLRKDRKFLFKFIEVKKHALIAAGIYIMVPSKGKPEYRYAKVLSQIDKLAPEMLILFRVLKEAFVNEELEKEDAIRENERLEFEKEQERQERLAALTAEKRLLLENIDPNMPIDDMPDCFQKYEKILERFAKDQTMFTDTQFPANEQSLGAGCTNRGVSKWVRASEMEDVEIYHGEIDARDVVQGALGDCYFLSAMSVLGNVNVKKTIRFTEESKTEEWKCGAFIVRFYKNGQVEYVVIDDYFPVMGNGELAFARGGTSGKELWPAVLEKAYAKLNGSFNYIEAGKVQYALADMTGGVSEQIDLKKAASNQAAFWENLKSLLSQGALMGAGSPEHAMGDTAINEYGIVQGHAYAVLGICEVDNYKLINVRNPHGNRGVEWNGDWSDDSEMWTQRAKNKCNYVNEDDGVFWMEIDDFIDNYSYLYVCRILKDWHKEEINDEWKGKTAEGLPSSKNRSAKLEFNPQYELKVNAPGPLFIEMNQFEKINMFKGKHFIMFMVSNTQGGKITRMDRKAILGMSGQPVNLNIISSEIQLTKKISFPAKITLLAANTMNGAEGEAKYALKIYSMSPFTCRKL